jgi:hypothetical protein
MPLTLDRRYGYLREMAVHADRSVLLRCWRANRALAVVAALLLLYVHCENLSLRAEIASSERKVRVVSTALLAGGCLLKDRPSALFMVGGNEQALQAAFMSVAGQVFSLSEAWRIAREKGVLGGERYTDNEEKSIEIPLHRRINSEQQGKLTKGDALK